MASHPSIKGMKQIAEQIEQALQPVVTWDRHSLMIDGRRVCPVMGEVHYSRIPANEWREEVRKMKEGGVTVIATYVFWNHIEEEEGIFRWDGQRNLRRFIEICKEENVPVILRLGPFCHGEVRNGGIPDWMFSKGCKLRDRNSVFLSYAEKLYRQIFTQVQGLQWKDGGPVMAAQFDNEYRGRGEYLMDLKRIAEKIGFDLPFYTRTGWPELSTPVPFGEMLPLYGDYADGFWDRSTAETAGNYYKAFNFKAFRSSTAIATEQLGDQMAKVSKGDEEYPYFTCELGGGMMQAYHRRPYVYAEDAYSMALVKLGSGSNLLGYYMYHGGTNPEGKTSLNENQRTQGTNYNDMPVKNYDFQAPLGEFGQTYPHYYMLRPLHLFMKDWGEMLAPMEASFPAPQDLKKGDDSQLRWAIRSGERKDERGEETASAFIFVNNYERLQNLSEKKNVVLEACGVTLPKLTIPAGCMAIFPVNIDGIKYATGQLVAKREGKVYMMQIPGIPTTICMQNGKTLKNVKAKGLAKPVYDNIYLLTKQEAEHLFLNEEKKAGNEPIALTAQKVKEAGPLRQITMGTQNVAEEPTDTDFEQAAVYTIKLPAENSSLFTPHSSLMKITYQGDCARLYASLPSDSHLVQERKVLIADHFQYGRPMLYGLWRLPEGCKELELRILPMQKDMPVYLPREANKTPGENVEKIEITTL
ncbi:MAG: beta-galactosidase [Prevotella sp.]|nr:beta-galactosidase [Prevotella sp.]